MSTEISISQFKSRCLEIIGQLQNSQELIVITKRQKPIATVQSLHNSAKTSIFGLFKDKAKIKADIVNPINENWSSANE